MATSGTVGQTTIPVVKLLERAIRRCGIPTSKITPEMYDIAAECLFYYTVSLSNDGYNLWCVERTVLGTQNAKYQYALPIGTLDVMKGLYRQNTPAQNGTAASSAGGTAANAFDLDLDTVCTQVSPNGNISYDFGEEVVVTNVAINANGAATYNPIFEYSNDAWVTSATLIAPGEVTMADREWACWDVANTVSARYYRIRETGGATLNVREIGFNQLLLEFNLERYNFDSYSELPQKWQSNRQVTNYWLDRQRDFPVAYVWPVPNYDFDQLVFWRQRHIQDIGTLRNTIDVPQRWYDALSAGLAPRMIFELEGADLNRLPMLKEEASEALLRADAEERDDSAVNMIPDVTAYTR